MLSFKNENKYKVILYDLEIEIELKKRNFDFDLYGNLKLVLLFCLIDIFEENEKIDFEEYLEFF